MRALVSLSRANLRSFVRDRAALFWMLAFPILFVVLFGTIFAGGGRLNYDVGWVDQDGTPGAAELRAAFDRIGLLAFHEGSLETERAAMERGDIDASTVVTAGTSARNGAEPSRG